MATPDHRAATPDHDCVARRTDFRLATYMSLSDERLKDRRKPGAVSTGAAKAHRHADVIEPAALRVKPIDDRCDDHLLTET